VGWLKFLGFAIPFAVAFDNNASPPRDALPSRGRCSLCKRMKDETYILGSGERACADDVRDVARRSMALRSRTAPRPVGEWPLEKVADTEAQLVPIDPRWDGWFK
jgi:hypothetical protein